MCLIRYNCSTRLWDALYECLAKEMLLVQSLQYSSVKVMNAWTSFSASETLNMFRSLEMFLRWKNAVFVTLEIWFSKDKLLSNITPRFLIVEEVTVHPSSCKLWSKIIVYNIYMVLVYTVIRYTVCNVIFSLGSLKHVILLFNDTINCSKWTVKYLSN